MFKLFEHASKWENFYSIFQAALGDLRKRLFLKKC